jgi:uncharacterized protein YfaS (alpha-2-macroglobulin family)
MSGLIDYPHGCVEQTMSRFLPAVVVRQTTRQVPLLLPPEVERKLPDILERGLTRLYHFQHADGGWGWWEHDHTDQRMSIYVVYGLARCQGAGTPVDRDILMRGCSYLKGELATDRFPQSLEGQAWLALALAGEADPRRLTDRAWAALGVIGTPELRCHLALACRVGALNEPAERLWASVRNWQPDNTEGFALKLNVQMAFGAPLPESRETARRLLARRVGLGWESTLATSRAIDGLSRLLAYETARSQVKRISVTVGGKALLELKTPEELNKLVYRLHLTNLPAGEALAIDLTAEADTLIPYTVVASGVQRLDKIPPTGTEVKLLRQLETLDGKLLTGPVRVGEVIAVRLKVELTAAQGYFLIEERRPAGCEFADDRVVRPDKGVISHVEFRDDRLCVYCASLPAGQHEFVYYLRAETAGRSHILPGRACPMYADHLRGETAGDLLEVR